jgi:SAM-dependent methyltransferase
MHILLCLLLLLPSTSSVQKKLDVPYLPTPHTVVNEMLRLAEFQPEDVLYDLGCGDGRIVIAAARLYGIHCVGVDIDPKRIQECRKNAANADVEEYVTFLEQDLFETDLRAANVVTLYLLNAINLKLRPKLLQELKPGTRIISHRFSMNEWRPDKTSKVYDRGSTHEVFYWVIPADVTGVWEMTILSNSHNPTYLLKMEQLFQYVNGTITQGKSQKPLLDTRLSGAQLEFTVNMIGNQAAGALVFSGQVLGNEITGRIKTKDGKSKNTWKAVRKGKYP